MLIVLVSAGIILGLSVLVSAMTYLVDVDEASELSRMQRYGNTVGTSLILTFSAFCVGFGFYTGVFGVITATVTNSAWLTAAAVIIVVSVGTTWTVALVSVLFLIGAVYRWVKKILRGRADPRN